MQQSNFRCQLLVICLAIGLLPFGFGLALLTWKSSQATEEQVGQRLTSLTASKAQKIEDYVHQIEDQARILSESAMIIDAMEQFAWAFEAVGQGAKGAATPALAKYYREQIGNKFLADTGSEPLDVGCLPLRNAAGLHLQDLYVAQNFSLTICARVPYSQRANRFRCSTRDSSHGVKREAGARSTRFDASPALPPQR
jgi:hypothetical protein